MKGKTLKKEASPRMKKAIDIIVANRGNIGVGEALKEAGYSKSISKNPHQITRSKSYRDYLDQVGLTSSYLSKKHRQLSQASKLETAVFDHIRKGKKKIRHTDEQIRLAIEGTEDAPTGNKITFIKEGSDCRVAYFRSPDNIVQKGALDMAFKVRGDYTADRAFEDLANHIIGEDEEQEIDKILKDNKKK